MKNVKPTKDSVLIQNGLIEIPTAFNSTLPTDQLATLLANLAYFGYTLSKEACGKLMKLDTQTATEWWYPVEKTLQEITGENRKMGKFVVYKNFPDEVLNMSQTEYWIKQIFMYIGLPGCSTQQKRSNIKMH